MSKLAQASPAWSFGFQCNERYLQWDGSAQARLVKLHCSEKLGWSVEQVCIPHPQRMHVLQELPQAAHQSALLRLLGVTLHRAKRISACAMALPQFEHTTLYVPIV